MLLFSSNMERRHLQEFHIQWNKMDIALPLSSVFSSLILKLNLRNQY